MFVTGNFLLLSHYITLIMPICWIRKKFIDFDFAFLLGVQAMDKISINKVYDKYFISKEIKQFEEFHIAFIDFCK